MAKTARSASSDHKVTKVERKKKLDNEKGSAKKSLVVKQLQNSNSNQKKPLLRRKASLLKNKNEQSIKK